MHPLNKILSRAGLVLTRSTPSKVPPGFLATFNRRLAALEKNAGSFEQVFREFRCDVGVHPMGHRDFECAFAARQMSRRLPSKVLDIGSYREFILGMLSHYDVTTVDVRSRAPISENETVVTCDAKALTLPDESFDAVVSLCALEHFGLGRYGDEYDLDGDTRAFDEMKRVLRPGGHVIFTTSISRAAPAIAFNAHRIYNLEMLQELCKGLHCEEENFFSMAGRKLISFDEITKEANKLDLYFGCWRKV